jgi:Predicted membrane protein (DUF2306)
MAIIAVDPATPWFVTAAADGLLAIHIGGGTIGMLSGAVALLARKGGWLHSISGKAFFVSMLCMAAVGAGVSAFYVSEGFNTQLPNVIAGVMTLYLVLTSWMTIRRKDGAIGRFGIFGFVVALSVSLAGATFIVKSLTSPTGTVGDTPPQAFYVFFLVGTISAASDLKAILKGGIDGVPRIARHLWRMCTALTIATGSFFLGQQRIMPASMQGSSLLYLPVFVPLLLMAFWLIRVRVWNARLWGGLRAKNEVGISARGHPVQRAG